MNTVGSRRRHQVRKAIVTIPETERHDSHPIYQDDLRRLYEEGRVLNDTILNSVFLLLLREYEPHVMLLSSWDITNIWKRGYTPKATRRSKLLRVRRRKVTLRLYYPLILNKLVTGWTQSPLRCRPLDYIPYT
jgi:hypothetical protein